MRWPCYLIYLASSFTLTKLHVGINHAEDLLRTFDGVMPLGFFLNRYVFKRVIVSGSAFCMWRSLWLTCVDKMLCRKSATHSNSVSLMASNYFAAGFICLAAMWRRYLILSSARVCKNARKKPCLLPVI